MSGSNDFGEYVTQALAPAAVNSCDPSFHASGVFPFEKLPVELQREIITFAIPQTLSFNLRPLAENGSQQPRWVIYVRELKSTGVYMKVFDNGKLGPFYSIPGQTVHNVDKALAFPIDKKELISSLHTYSVLLRIKTFANEARAIFFDHNEIALYINDHDRPSAPVCPEADTLPFLRDIKSLRIRLNICTLQEEGFFRLSRRLARLTDAFNKAEDESILKRLEIGMAWIGNDYEKCSTDRNVAVGNLRDREYKILERNPFAMEASLGFRHVSTIEEVRVSGALPWFNQCIEMCIRGRGGPLERVIQDNPDVNAGQGPDFMYTVEKWDTTHYKWRDFAQRNGISIPEDQPHFFELE